VNPLFYLRSLQNSLNFAIRSKLSWSRPLSGRDALIVRNEKLQAEFKSFLELFDWDELGLVASPGTKLKVADVGARDFSFGPVIRDHFEAFGFKAEIHGIEIDAFRRYSNFRSRADYGRYYADQLEDGAYHAIDFLNWHEDLDVCFLLHPFVTPEPPLRWGLPLGAFKPRRLFDHAAHLLRKKTGTLVLSSPTSREFEISCRLAQGAGLELSELKLWRPSEGMAHQRPRFGAIFKRISV
jgi:hypothetical protein